MRTATARARFGFLVHDVSRMRRIFFDQALKPHGITRAQRWALGNLSRHADEGMIQTELAKVLDTGKVSVGGLSAGWRRRAWSTAGATRPTGG